MSNDYYNESGVPSTGAQGASSTIRSEFTLIGDGFDKLPTLTANAGKIIAVNAGSNGLEAITAVAGRATLGLVIGGDVQAYNAALQAIAGLTTSADKVPYYTGSGTAALADFTTAGRALVGGADAAAQRTTLGLGNVDNTSDATKNAATANVTNKTLDNTNRIAGGPTNAQTGTTYTFVLTDAGKLVTFNNGSTQTITVPANASVAFGIGDQIDIIQLGAGKVTFTPAGGVTIRSQSSLLSIGARYIGVTLKKIDTNEWVLVGSLIA
jgi:hypothetical protein